MSAGRSAGKASLFGSHDRRSRRARLLALAGQTLSLPRLPPAAVAFYLRAVRHARRHGDTVSLAIAARPRELAELVRAARGARVVAEVGTGTCWTAIVLAIADAGREVLSFDVAEHEQRAAYLRLAPPAARERLRLAIRDGRAGPPPGLSELDFLFVDSSHELEETVATFQLWSERLRPGGTAALHDYANPRYPGVAAAVERLGLAGAERAGMFFWRKPPGVSGEAR